jgi:hypothetical protein
MIFKMVAENSTWGAPRIHGELLMLGFDVSERTIPDGCAKPQKILNKANDSSLPFAIIVRRLPRCIFHGPDCYFRSPLRFRRHQR